VLAARAGRPGRHEGYGVHQPSTVRQAKVHIQRIVQEFGPYPVSSLRPSQIRAWITRLRKEELKASYIYALHGRLAQVMTDAVHDGLIARSPCSRRTSPGVGEQRVYVATTEQVWQLYELFPERMRLAMLLGALVGLRLSETCGLERAMRKARSKVKGLPAGFRYHDLRHYFARVGIGVTRRSRARTRAGAGGA
jgi:integrase